MVKAIYERLRQYYIEVLFTEEDFDVAAQRFIRSAIQNGSDEAFRTRPGEAFSLPFDSLTDDYYSTNMSFPFTAYSLAHPIYDETRINHLAKSGAVYSECLNAFVATWPMEVEIPFITFYATVDDYMRAVNILNEQAASLTRLDATLIANGVEFTMPFDISIDISKGQYFGEFAEWLRTGEINDIVHTTTVKFYDIRVGKRPVDPVTGQTDYSQKPDPSVGIFPVDTICINLNNFDDGSLIDSIELPAAPQVESSSIEDGATGVAREDLSITFDLTLPMVESSLADAIFISPVTNYHLEFNDDITQVTIIFDEKLLSLVEYTVGILDTAKSGDNQTLPEDFLISFTTGTV
jgi:hypothetical protein